MNLLKLMFCGRCTIAAAQVVRELHRKRRAEAELEATLKSLTAEDIRSLLRQVQGR